MLAEYYFYGLLLHLIGDYVLQSDYMATEKVHKDWPAIFHAAVYSAPFLLIVEWPYVVSLVFATHALIDRFRLARYVVYLKNFLSPFRYWYTWDNCKSTGYHNRRPPWLSVWLLIIADNAIHISINTLAIYLSVRT